MSATLLGVTRKRWKVVVVDERPGMGLAGALAAVAGVRVCAEAGTAAEAIEAIESWKPDCLVVDCSLPRLGGLSLVRAARRLHPDLPIVAISPEGGRQRAAAALKAGAQVFLLREGACECFLAALAAAELRKPYVDPRVAVAKVPARSKATAK